MSDKFYKSTDEFTDLFGGRPIYFKVDSEGQIFGRTHDGQWLNMTGPHPITQYKDEQDLIKCYSHDGCVITEVQETEIPA